MWGSCAVVEGMGSACSALTTCLSFLICKWGSACPPQGWRKDWCSAWHLASALGTQREGRDARTETAPPARQPAGRASQASVCAEFWAPT